MTHPTVTDPATQTASTSTSYNNYCYHRARYYDPQTGRFLQRDPLGYLPGPGLYEYAVSHPTMTRDPLGLDPDGGCDSADPNARADKEMLACPGKPTPSQCKVCCEEALQRGMTNLHGDYNAAVETCKVENAVAYGEVQRNRAMAAGGSTGLKGIKTVLQVAGAVKLVRGVGSVAKAVRSVSNGGGDGGGGAATPSGMPAGPAITGGTALANGMGRNNEHMMRLTNQPNAYLECTDKAQAQLDEDGAALRELNEGCLADCYSRWCKDDTLYSFPDGDSSWNWVLGMERSGKRVHDGGDDYPQKFWQDF